MDDLLERSGEMDIYVVHGRPGAGGRAPSPARRCTLAWRGYVWALVGLIIVSLAAWAFRDIGLAEANKAIVFLLAIALIAARFGLGPGILATVLGVLAFDFLFVPPYLTFAVADAQFVITFAVMLVVALIISTLAARLRRQVHTSRARERRLEALYRLSRELSAVSGTHQLASDAATGGVWHIRHRGDHLSSRGEGQTGTGCLHRESYGCRFPRAGGGDMGIRTWPACRQWDRHVA